MLDAPDIDRADAQETDARYAIGDLAEAAGVSRRAVRFYVQRGLLPAPHGGGRGAFYTSQHLARLETLKRLQEAGLPLDEIARTLDGEAPTGPPEPHGVPVPGIAPRGVEAWEAPWIRLALAPGVELSVQPSRVSAGLRQALVEALTRALAGAVQRGEGTDGEALGEGRRAGPGIGRGGSGRPAQDRDESEEERR